MDASLNEIVTDYDKRSGVAESTFESFLKPYGIVFHWTRFRYLTEVENVKIVAFWEPIISRMLKGKIQGIEILR